MKDDVITRHSASEERGAVQFGALTFEYTVTRSRRRKRTIEITLDHGADVVVVAPMRTPAERIRQVVLKRAGWIVQKTAQVVLHPRRRELVSGESLLYLGGEARLSVECADIRRTTVDFEDLSFRISVPAWLDGEERRTAIESAVVRWYKARAVEHLAQQVERWSKVVSLIPAQVLVRDQRRRWGSCSPDGKLRFNWRLIMASPMLIDYVVVHELLHLRIKNHSAAFWAEMARLMPDCKARRSALKEIGPRLTV